jgi:hypothetical protein
VLTPTSGSYTNLSSVHVAWQENDNASGVAYCLVRIDGGVWQNASLLTLFSFFDLLDGSHTVELVVFDRAGNTATDSVSFTVDTIAPSLSIVTPEGGSWVNRSSVTVVCTGNDDGSMLLGYQYKLDNGAWSDRTVSDSVTFSDLAQDNHIVYVRLFDNANNVVSLSVGFRVDSVLPEVAISSPAEGFLSDTDHVTFIWSGDDSGSGLTGYRYRMDGGSWSSSSLLTDLTLTSIADLHRSARRGFPQHLDCNRRLHCR